MFKKTKNIFIYIALIVVLLFTGYMYMTQQKGISIPFLDKFSLSNNEYNMYSEGSNDITISGVLNYNKEDFNYYASFKETYMVVEQREKSSKFAVKKVGSGLLAFDELKKAVALRIDYEDSYNEKENRNVRNYLIDLQDGERSVKIEKEVYLTNQQPSPLEGLDLVKIMNENSVELTHK